MFVREYLGNVAARDKEASMSTKRKDTKGRILRDGEIQKADGRYEFRYYDAKSERRSIYSWRLTTTDQIPEGKRECLSLREMERDILRDVQDGLLTQQKVALNARWDDYIANKPELKQSTRTNYRYMYDKYVREEIGHLEVTTINYSTMKKFFNHLLHDCGFKPNSVEIVHTILHPVFTIAMRDGLIRMNPTDGIMADLKRSNDWEKPKRHALTEEQQRAFMAYVETSDKYRHWNPLFACLLGTGCRIGEMLGLRWEDVLWKENIISINHNLIYRLQDNGKVEFHITTPKTRKGIRVIPMFQNVRRELQNEYLRQQEDGFCQDVVDGYCGFIWQNRFGNVLSPHCVNRAIARIVDDYNQCERRIALVENRDAVILPHFSVHQLRHTFCTRLCERERDLKLIQEIMGHADISTTMDVYNESNTDRKKASFARLEAITDLF